MRRWSGALGGVIGEIAAKMQRDARGRPPHRCLGRGAGRRRGRACAPCPALGWDHAGCRRGGGVAGVDPQHRMAGGRSACHRLLGRWPATPGCRAFDINGVVTDNIFVAGDIARAPHVLYDYQFLSLEHWDNAVSGPRSRRTTWSAWRPAAGRTCRCPSFWSGQFGVNIKGVGVCSFGDEIVFTQGSRQGPPLRRRLWPHGAASWVRLPSITANGWSITARMIERSAPFPPPPPGYDRPKTCQADAGPVPGSARADGASRRRLDRP